MSGSLKAGDLEDILAAMKALFASIPYELHMKAEAYYSTWS